MPDASLFHLRVHYEDTDFSGFVYHANYLKYCERARSDYLRRQRRRPERHVLKRMTPSWCATWICDFLAPARFNDELVVATEFREMGGARFELFQSVKRGEQTLFTAAVTVVLIDGKGRPRRIPSALA